MMKKIITAAIISFVSLLIFSCDSNEEEVSFSYNSIIDKEYRFSVGRIIPVTIGKSIETDGDISLDSRFFYYSSNREGGNFDIYLRSMRDITTVRLTSHPSKDINPVVSPDNKSVAFISFRDDPEGDIFVIEHDPAELIEKAAVSTTRLPSLDSTAINITLEKDPQTDVVINIKDSSPSWSPDGKLIAYSSSRGNITGDTDIWVMEPDGSNRKKITTGGADFPSFSADGKTILFVSYKDNRKGDIRSIEIGSGKETLIAEGNYIKMDPVYAGNKNEIIYSSIEADTNSNGMLDLQDRSVIRYLNTRSGLTYPLTRKSLSSFKAKWLPVLQTRDYKGIIIFTDIRDESINLNIIPEKGIVPKKLNARQQYDICDDYITEYDDHEKYAMALESVYYFFGDLKDPSSLAYVNRALGEAASWYRNQGRKNEAEQMVSFLKARAENKDIYAETVIENLVKSSSSKLNINDALKRTDRLAKDEKNRYFAPFALEDLADIAYGKNSNAEAVKIYNTIIKDYPSFERIQDIHTKAAVAGDDLKKGTLSESAVTILEKGRTNQKITLIKHLAADFENKKYNTAGSSGYLKSLDALKEKYSSSKKITALLHYASGLILDNRGDKKKAAAEYSLSIEASHPNDITYYLSNIRLGEIARISQEQEEAEKYFSAAINRYSRRFKTENFRDYLVWTINYYEKAGEKSEAAENYKEAASIYEKYINMITLTYNKRLFTDVYSEYAPRAHILYIDSVIALKGADAVAELEQSYTDRLPIYRMDFNKAALYGLAYIYTQKGLSQMRAADSPATAVSISDAMESFKKADSQIEWALFIDDTFIEPYLLKTWIYQYIDTERKNRDRSDNSAIAKFFPERLWEENIQVLEKALNANSEDLYPENEGNINLNMANNYFLLLNYPRALRHYKEADKYKKYFNSEIEKALFHFHYGYCYWQNGETGAAKAEIEKAYNIYRTLAASAPPKQYANQYLVLYRYFALINRYEEKYDEAINWYQRILDFADSSGISIDKARYLQEIAHCYIEKGELETASIFINRSKAILKNYPDDERKYYLTIRIFGIGPIPVFNMGPDNAVIGSNRIFHPLDRDSKKLLNISMLEEISLKNNDYSEAIKLLKEKIKLLKELKTSVAVESRIRSLNNIGFYYYESGRFNDAEKYFNLSRKESSDNNNLEGLFASIMNLTNLYALLIENNISPERDWIKDTGILSSSIDKYRSNYYDLRIKEEKESLKSAAKAKKTKVTPQEIKQLEERIKTETAEKYFALETASGILKFYRGELLFNSAVNSSKTDFRAPYEVLEKNHEIYSLYAEALSIFERGYEIAKERGQKTLMTKLLFNMAVCYEKTGETEKAYVALIDAKNLAEQNSYSWLTIDASYRMGRFLASSGRDVEKGDYSLLAKRNFESAVAEIEKTPLLYSVHSNRIKVIYDDYINFLIKRGSSREGFILSENKLRILRLMAVNSLSPKFSDDELSSLYYSYNGDLKKLKSIKNSISSLLESGIEKTGERIKALEKESSALLGKLDKTSKAISVLNPLYRSYLYTGDVKIPSISTDIYKFQDTPDGLFYWKISEGKINSAYIENSKDISSITGIGSGSSRSFVILNDTLISILKGKPEYTGSLRLITGIDRASLLTEKNITTAPSILTSIKGVENKIKTPEVTVHLKNAQRSVRDYSLLIEKSGEADSLTPEIIFSSHGIVPSCLIISIENPDYNYLSAFLEAGVYAGIPSIIFALTENSEDLALAADSYLMGKPIGGENQNFIISGNINSFTGGPAPGNPEKEMSQFKKAMALSNFDKARMHLSRWGSLNGGKDRFSYYSQLWMLELLKGDYEEAGKALQSAEAEMTDSKEFAVRKIYHLLYTGDFTGAAQSFKSNEETIKNTKDYSFIKAFFIFSQEGAEKCRDYIYAIAEPSNTLIPAERYRILLTRYFSAEGVSSAAGISDDSIMSLNEILSQNIPYSIQDNRAGSGRFENIASLKNRTGELDLLKDSLLRLTVTSAGYDSFSPFPLIYALTNFEMFGVADELFPVIMNLDFTGIISQADTADSLTLLYHLEDLFTRYEKHSSAIPLQDMIIKISAESGLPYLKGEALYRKALSSMITGDMDRAYASAMEADRIIKPQQGSRIDLDLLLMNLMIRGNSFKEAREKGDALNLSDKLTVSQKYLLNLQLSLVELNRLSSLKSATKSDADKFEALFLSSIQMLKNDISILEASGYSQITDQVFDEFINYKMRTGQHTDAHHYNEIKKLALISLKTGKNYLKESGAIDIQAMQQSLPSDSVYINISKNKNDLFVWLFDRKSRRALVIEKGYEQIQKFNNEFNPALAKRSDAADASSRLYDILRPVMNIAKGKKYIIFSLDESIEKTPLDIAGDKSTLADQAGIFYMVSPMLTDFSRKNETPVLTTAGKRNSITAELEITGIKHSGIKRGAELIINEGIAHITGDIKYNTKSRGFTIDSKDYASLVKGADLVYASVPFADFGFNNLAAFIHDPGTGSAIINGAALQDVNNAFFAEYLYSEISKGRSYSAAFTIARKKIRDNDRFASPGYWAGTRYYINSFNFND